MTITSGGKRKPAKADGVAGAGRERRVLIAAVSLLDAVAADATVPSEVGLGQLVPMIETSEIAVLSWSGSPGAVATTSMSTQLAVTSTVIRCMVG